MHGWSTVGAIKAEPSSVVGPEPHFSLNLLGGFHTADGGSDVVLPSCTWRLVAFLAIADRPVDRGRVASSLWLDKPEARATANLRSCLWRLRQVNAELVVGTSTHLQIGAQVRVDLREFVRLARELGDHRVVLEIDEIDLTWFSAELLPDWYDDFVEAGREQFRQLRLHALESLAVRLGRAGRADLALEVALTALATAPLRESAHRLVISLHLDEGNVSEALRQYRSMSALFERHLAVEPSPAVRRLVARWLPEMLPDARLDAFVPASPGSSRT